MISVLLYGDVDLNLIDGSAIWLTSVAEMLAGAEDVSVTVLQKTRLTRDVVTRSVACMPNISFVDPWNLGHRNAEAGAVLEGSPKGRLSPQAAAGLVALLDRSAAYDVLLIRGFRTAAVLADMPSTARRLWAYITDPTCHAAPLERAILRGIAERCGRVLCQTEEAKAALMSLIELQEPGKIDVLPPMIPALSGVVRRPPDLTAPRLGYSGKFSAQYMICEMLDAFEAIRARIPGAEFHLVGDKFHDASGGKHFAEAVTQRLKSTPGVVWHGGVSRTEVHEILSRVDVASSWRDASMDGTVEMSTKVLEYSAMGIPVLMNPSSVQRRVFGPDYPGYVTSQTEFVEKFLALSHSPGLHEQVSQFVRATAAEFTFDSNRRRLLPILKAHKQPRQVARPQPTILWVGHDLKFLRPLKEAIERAAGYRSLVDQQDGHVLQQPERSRILLEQADLVFCEWCLGNAEWYSKHKRAKQRLVVRLHRQEIELPFLHQVQWENVDRVIFIAQWVMEYFLSMYPSLKNRAVLIPNAIDCRSLNVEKLPGAEYNLGMLGFCPKLKAPHLAFEILTRLKEADRRYTLFIKGRSPRELDWLWKRPEERRYYEDLWALVDASPFANSIVFDPYGDDVAGWLSKIGFILSVSDFEGSHQAVAEGMASGAVPVIRAWRGANQIYPQRYIFGSSSEGADLVRKWNTRERRERESMSCCEWARRFDLPVIVEEYVTLLSCLLPGAEGVSLSGKN